MLVIRMQRTGRRNHATFRLVLQERSQAPKSAAKEILGNYDPHAPERKDQIQIKEDRIKYWLSVGAQPSATVHNMLIELGVITGDKRRSVQPKLKKQEEGAEGGDAPAATTEKKDDAAEEKPAEEKKEEKSEEKEEKKEEEKKED